MTSSDSKTEQISRRRFFQAPLSTVSEDPGGGFWQRIDGLDAGSGDVFWAGWASESEIFVGGDEGMIFRFDGRDWTRVPAPVRVPIHALWGPDRERLVAVGWMGAVLAFDGVAWTLLRGCVVGENERYAPVEENVPLFDVTGSDDGQLWAVGDNGTILTRDEAGWRFEDSGTTAHLRAVAGLTDGRLAAAGGDGTVLLRSQDGAWERLDCPVRSGFQAILPAGDDAFLLAGGRYFADSNGFRGDLLRWQAGTFETIEAERPFSRLRALAPYQGGALIVGDQGQIHLFRDGHVRALESATRHDLLGVVPLATGEALAVGDFGTVLMATPTLHEAVAAPSVFSDRGAPHWERMVSGTDRQLWGVWSDPRDQAVYACGEEGTVLRLSDGTWEALPPPAAIGLHSVCAADDDGLFAAGQLGEIHHFDGSTWRKHFDLHVDVTILSLWSEKSGGTFAVGDEGLVLQWDGASWQRITSGTKSALYGLWGQDRDHLLAVGDFGLVLRWNGTRWDEFFAGTENFLFDVWGDALDNIFVVGLSGTIGHFDGRHWTVTPARARADLLAVHGFAGEVFAVGTAGSLLRHADGQWHAETADFDGGLRGVTVSPSRGVLAVGDGGTILRRRGGVAVP